jgi:hypothetical protein
MRQGWQCAALVALALTVTGCDKNDRKEKAECAAEVAGLRAWIAQLDAEGNGGGGAYGELPDTKGKLVQVGERANGLEDGPILTMNGALLLVDGSPSGTAAHPADATKLLSDQRRARGNLWAETHPGKSPPADDTLVAVFGAGDDWSAIATALDSAARAGYTRTVFVFEGRTKLTAPPPTPYSRRLEKLARHGESVDPSQKARIGGENELSESARQSFGLCPDIAKAVEPLSSASLTPHDRQAELDKRIPDAIEQCGCKVDLNGIKAVYWFQYGRYQGTPKVGHALAIAPHDGTTGVTEVGAPQGATWVDVAPRVIATSEAGQKASFAITASAD